MQVKKIFAIALSLMLFLVSIVPVFAEESQTISISEGMQVINIDNEEDDIEIKKKEAKISKDKALEIAKEALKSYFEYEIDEKKFESRIEFREGYGPDRKHSWSIDLYWYEENTNISIAVLINADNGKVNRINMYEYGPNDGPIIAKITEEEAEIKAEAFVKRVNPNEYKEVKLEEIKYPGLRGNTHYNFNYIRHINGVPFKSNQILIRVDCIKGKVVEYSYIWDEEAAFPSLDDIIGREQAEKIIRDNVEMTLRYIPSRNRYDYQEKVKEAKLIYNPEFENRNMVDAKEETMISYRGKSLEEEKIKDITEERKENIFKSSRIVTKQNKEISEDRAREVVGKYILELYGDGYEIDRLRYIESDDYWITRGKKAWSADFMKKEVLIRGNHGQIVIDALTEELISAHRYEDFDQEIEKGYEPVITWEEGYYKAIEALERYFPGKIKDIDTEARYRKHTSYRNGKKMPELKYYFTFQRKVNGIYYSHDSISFDIDTKEGNVVGLRYRWNDEIEFPEADKSMCKEDAAEIFFEKYRPELSYRMINNSSNFDSPDWEIKLVYMLPYEYYTGIDAFTGKSLDSWGQDKIIE